jgi:hypothetical protein
VAQRGVEVLLYSSKTSALEGGEWSAARLGHTLPPGFVTMAYVFQQQAHDLCAVGCVFCWEGRVLFSVCLFMYRLKLIISYKYVHIRIFLFICFLMHIVYSFVILFYYTLRPVHFWIHIYLKLPFCYPVANFKLPYLTVLTN